MPVLITLAVVLREIDADVVNVVEVQDCNALNALNTAIGTSAGYRVRESHSGHTVCTHRWSLHM